MLREPDNKAILTTNRLTEDLSNIIEKKHQDLHRVINSELITLFWKIGTELNKLNLEDFFLKNISKELSLLYGSYFTESNMDSMRIFANQFSDKTHVNSVALFVTWEHILLYIQIEDVEARLFYIKRTIEVGLSVSNLNKEISGNVFEGMKGLKKRSTISVENKSQNKSDDEYLKIMRIGLNRLSGGGGSVVKNHFKKPLLNSFHSLLEPSKNPLVLSTPSKAFSSAENLFFILSQEIDKFRQQQNSWLNTHLNLTFLEIGNRINQEIKTIPEIHTIDSLLRGVATNLKRKYTRSFSKKQLLEMAVFAESANQIIKHSVACQLSWPHILKLLPLTKNEEWIFYAQLAISEGLSPNQLQKKIIDKMYGKRVVTDKNSRMLIQNSMKNKTTIEKKKGSITILNTVYISKYDFNKGKLFLNIFKNPYFYLLSSDKKIEFRPK